MASQESPPSPASDQSTPSPPSPGSDFTNQRVHVGEGLPTLDDDAFEPVDRAYSRMRLSVTAVIAAVVIAATAIAGFGLGDDAVDRRLVPVAAGAALVLFGTLAWFQRVEVDHMGYQVRTHDFSFRRGVVWRRVDTMPFARVQHAVIRRGPVERLFDLATLHLRSAGGSLLVTGLKHSQAEGLKTLVVERAGALADEELADQT